jgi:tRNA dimethylallyltransferase
MGSTPCMLGCSKVYPLSAVRIDARNVRRVVRALEINEATGQPASAQRRVFAYRILRLGRRPARRAVRPHLAASTACWTGTVDEVRRLLPRLRTRPAFVLAIAIRRSLRWCRKRTLRRR